MLKVFLAIWLLGWIAAQNTNLESLNKRIKVGLVAVQLNEEDQGSISITYKTPMPDHSYRSLAAPAYIFNFSPNDGLHIGTDCSGSQNQTQLRCTILANSTSSYSRLYMTYIVSDEEDFLIGTFVKQFQLQSTFLVSTVEHQVDVAQDSVFRRARGEIDFIPFISGVTSFDSDFGLQLSLVQSFDTLTATLQISVQIQELHDKNVEVTFGFILFLPNVYIINSYPDYMLKPDNNDLNKQVLFYIQNIEFTAQNTTNRLLQTIPLSVSNNASRIYNETISSRRENTKSLTNNVTIPDRAQQQRIFEQIIISGNFSLKNFIVRTTNPLKSLSTTLYDLRSSILGSSPSTETSDFEKIFTTNGLTIILNSSVSDPIIYLELTSFVDLEPQRFIAPLGSQSAFISPFVYPHSATLNIIINTKIPVQPACSNGFLVFRLSKIDQIQYTYKYVCLTCSWGQYFDWSEKQCKGFPLIPYVNVVDLA